MTREQMEEHERWISQPAWVLFPPQKKTTIEARCRNCKDTFPRKLNVGGKARLYCSERCRDEHHRRHQGAPRARR